MGQNISTKAAVWRFYVTRSLAVGVVFAFVGALLSAGLQKPTVASAAGFDSVQTASSQTISAAQYDPNYLTSPMPDLKVTVNQTDNLTSQAIYLNWTGGKQSSRPSRTQGGTNFLQIAQCWGDDSGNIERPDRTTCVYGIADAPGASRDMDVNLGTLSEADKAYSTTPVVGSGGGYWALPFNSYTGETVNSLSTDENTQIVTRNFDAPANDNPFFTKYTTNFVPWAGSAKNGTGASKFETQTNMQSPGLGCGTPIISGTSATGKSCWLVIIPRGEADNGQTTINSPGLMSRSWSHHIAFRLKFKPVGINCEIGSSEVQATGGELITEAMSSWQPKLCKGAGAGAFVIATANEQDSLSIARDQQDAPLTLTSYPLQDDSEQLAYAPIGVSGISISFAIDRFAPFDSRAPQTVSKKNNTPFDGLNLTPRLIAKLLTASYGASLPPGDTSHIGRQNSNCLTKDPDFLAVNDSEWRFQDVCGTPVSDMLFPIGRSDVAQKLWEYVVSDIDAREFLDGKPDPWGMKINPWFTSNEVINPSGTASSYPRRDFPKADPIEVKGTLDVDPDFGLGPINLVTYRPYTSDFQTDAYLVLRGDPQELGQWSPTSVPKKYLKTPPLAVGYQKIIALTTYGSAARYGNVVASLQNSAGKFVKPTVTSMSAAQDAFTPVENSSISGYDFESLAAIEAEAAYPLTMPIYAAVNFSKTSPDLLAKYVAFINYAATKGQIQGTEAGQLPEGYAPLSSSLTSQSLQLTSLLGRGVNPNAVPSPEPNLLPTTEPSLAPSAEPTGPTPNQYDLVFGPKTPKDPNPGPLSQSVPTGFALGTVAGAFWARSLNRKRRTKN